jgi:hypothetical protein
MIYRDPRCVHVDDSLAHANLVVVWLESQGIFAQVMNELTLGGFDGLVSILPNKLGIRGVEVWVDDPANAERARQMLAEHAELLVSKAARSGNVDALCEECGATSTFPAAEQGTIQDCPHCGAMLDVPDADGDWDVGEPEIEAEE